MKEESATGSSSASKVRTILTLSVEAVEFDTIACTLRIKGRNIQENQYVKVIDELSKEALVIMNNRWVRIILLTFN